MNGMTDTSGSTRDPGSVSASNPLGLPSNATCKAPSHFMLKLHRPHGQRIVSVRAYVEGKLVKRRSGRDLTSISIPHLIQSDQDLRIVARTSRGRRFVSERQYRGCAPRNRRSARH